MEIIWQKAPLTITEIRAALDHTGWSASTIKTLVRRLHQKGAINIDESKSPFSYSPAVKEAKCKRQLTLNFLDRVYQGSVKLMMTNLAQEKHLSNAELEQLLGLVDKLEGGGEK